MKAADFSRKARAPTGARRSRSNSRPAQQVDPGSRCDSAVDTEVAPALLGIDAPIDRAAALENSIEDPLADWPEGGSSGSDEWLRDRVPSEGSSST